MGQPVLDVHPDVVSALQASRPVVALESTLIAHGLPWPVNLETAREAENAIRQEGGVPATVAVWEGRPTIGLSDAQLEALARGTEILKVSRGGLAVAMAGRRTAATTVAATMWLAHRAGIRVFATGGIGGVQRGGQDSWDISADLLELARTPVAVICAGAKSILDIPRTLEILETQGVPVLGYRTDEFPAFYVRSSHEPVSARVESPAEIADVLQAHWSLDGGGVVVAQPVATEVALSADDMEAVLHTAEQDAAANSVRGPALTPFLLARLAELTQGKTLRTNQALVIANARVAAAVAAALRGECLGPRG